MSEATRAEICALACARAWLGDGEILASPIGNLPTIGARLARATFEPDLLLSDGEATLVAGTWAIGTPAPGPAEGWVPYRFIFDIVWHGTRHVMMGPSQLDRYGNANISCIGPFERPKAQLLGSRGAPGNTICHPTSYWVPKHSARVFVETVDMVSGIGYDKAQELGDPGRFCNLRRIVTNLCVLDFETRDHSMRLASVHPGVSVDEVIEQTGFELVVEEDVPVTEVPDAESLRLIRDVIDPKGLRDREVAA